MTTVLRDDGTVSHLQMTKKAFFATHTDFRNKPGRTGVPMRLTYDAKAGGTMLVQVVFVCDHGTPTKVACAACGDPILVNA